MANQRYLAVVSPSFLAIRIGTFLINGTGNHNRIPEILKNRWHMETLSEFSKSSPSCASAASTEVNVVPILDPSVSGYILSIVITPIPQSGVNALVNILDDWTRIDRKSVV